MSQIQNLISGKTVFERAILSVVKIEVAYQSGKTSVGTGFFFEYAMGKDQAPCSVLITNKHLIKNSLTGRVWIPTFTDSGIDFATRRMVQISNFEDNWIGHEDGDVDLCALPQSVITDFTGPGALLIGFNRHLLPYADDLNNMYAVEEIYMIGCPLALWDEFNSVPIVRKGVTATPPFCDFKSSASGLIDIACVPGSSGSPVLILREGKTSNLRGTAPGAQGKPLAILLGVHNKRMNWIAKEQSLPAHLGSYIKSSEIIALESTIRRCMQTDNRALNWDYENAEAD